MIVKKENIRVLIEILKVQKSDRLKNKMVKILYIVFIYKEI